MLKRILAGLSASAVIVLTVGAAPAAALSRNMPASTDYVISLTGVADSSLSASQQNCMRPYSHDLQDALDAYDNGDIIYLCPGVYVGPFSATHGDGLTLVGANPRTTIIDGASSGDSTIYIDTDSYFTVQNLTFRNGYVDTNGEPGAAIHTDNAFTCINSTFEDNETWTSGYHVGGAVATDGYGDVEVNRCTFKNNKAADEGGAIYVGNAAPDYYADFICNASTFVNNRAYLGSGPRGWGGAVHVVYDATINRCSFNGNHGNFGGAIFMGGNLTVRDSTFTNNEAYCSGGAVQLQGYFGTSTMFLRSTFTGNHTLDGDCPFYSWDEDVWVGGGAIFSLFNTITTVSSKFTNNTSLWAGGAIASLESIYSYSSTYTGNRAYAGGGALYQDDNYLYLYEGNVLKRNYSISGGGFWADNVYVDAVNIFSGNVSSWTNEDGARADGGYGVGCSEIDLPPAIAGYWDIEGFHNGSQTIYAGC